MQRICKEGFLAFLHDSKPSACIMTGVLGEATVRELEIGLAGSVVGPEDPNYETARHVWNHAVDKRPGLIVRAATTEDVARAVGFARSEGRAIAVRGVGTAWPASQPATTGSSSTSPSSMRSRLMSSLGGPSPAEDDVEDLRRGNPAAQAGDHRRTGFQHRYRRLHPGRRHRQSGSQMRAHLRQPAIH